MERDIAIILAWPETKCKQAGAWYDSIMRWINFNNQGYYKVGHAAIVLIKKTTGVPYYFDFGRYHSPLGKGRVRDYTTDHDLSISTRMIFNETGELANLPELLLELQNNESCHGDGELRVAWTYIDFDKCYNAAKQLQQREFISYGPFVVRGTNCSRFVRKVALSGMDYSVEKIKLIFPLTMSPTPIGNVKSVGEIKIADQKIRSVYAYR